MTTADLDASILDMKKTLTKSMLRIKAGKMDDFSTAKKTRKSIARITTIINEKEME